MQVHVAEASAIQLLHTPALEHLLRLGLRAFANLDLFLAFQRWDLLIVLQKNNDGRVSSTVSSVPITASCKVSGTLRCRS